jgi:membrane protein required for colicin V production
MDLNYFDIAIVVVILITALIGFMRGFVWLVIFIATWAAAIFLAFKYKGMLAEALPVQLSSEVAQTGLSILLIFLGILIVGAIINYLFCKAVSAIGLGTFDRILGAGLGIALGALAITLLTMLLALTELPDQDLWKNSRFVPKFQEAAAWIKTLIPGDFNQYNDQNLGTGDNTNKIVPSTPDNSGNSTNNDDPNQAPVKL